MLSIPSLKVTRQSVKVICIPVDGSVVHIREIPLRERTFDRVSFEDHLDRIPYLPENQDWQAHEWKDRVLVDLGEMDPEQTQQARQENIGPYLMYTTSGADAMTVRGMQNRHFEVAGCVRPIYGNVFIFQLDPTPSDDIRKRYDRLADVDKGFIDFAFDRMGISCLSSLRWLAAQEPGGDQTNGSVETLA